MAKVFQCRSDQRTSDAALAVVTEQFRIAGAGRPVPEMPEDSIPYGSQSIWWITDVSNLGNVKFDSSYTRNALTPFPTLDSS